MKNKLIINTANEKLFVALLTNNEVFSCELQSSVKHNEALIPTIDELLKSHSLDISDIDEFGVVTGPGSFTGVRVGISTIKAFRDATKKPAKGINNLDYLFALATDQNKDVETVAIKGSQNSFFVATKVLGKLYEYSHNITEEELKSISKNKPIGTFENYEELNCFVVKNNAKILFDCLCETSDENLQAVYYQLSQAENEKLKKGEVEILEAEKQDYDKIIEIENSSIATDKLTKTQLEAMLNSKIFKLNFNKELVAYIVLQQTDELNVTSVAVNKNFRNLGFATRLLNRAKEYAKSENISALSLEVSENNLEAYLLYKKFGFEQRRIRKNYYNDGSNCIEMVLKI